MLNLPNKRPCRSRSAMRIYKDVTVEEVLKVC